MIEKYGKTDDKTYKNAGWNGDGRKNAQYFCHMKKQKRLLMR